MSEVTKLCFDLSEEPCATLVALINLYNIAWCPGSPGAPVHWFTWCTGAPVHLVHRFSWCTGSPGAPVHLVHRFTGFTGSPGPLVHWFTWCTGSLVHRFTFILMDTYSSLPKMLKTNQQRLGGCTQMFRGPT